ADLHALGEFEMADKVREVLANAEENEFLPFKALVDLKDAGKKYNVETLSHKEMNTLDFTRPLVV
ncbi:hypothetical protein ACN4F5_12035, partial [Aliarcobacter butzleri]